MGGRWDNLTAADRAGFEQVAALVRDALGETALGSYVHGSATLGGLRPRSDLDVLVVAQRPTTRAEKERLTAGLLPSRPTQARRGPSS
jgi:predicted nucleotidyltransferase